MTTSSTTGTDATEGMPRKDVWRRGAYMLFFIVATYIAQLLINLIAVVQFLWLLLTGAPIEQLTRFGAALGQWAAAMMAFQSGATEEKPFPWADWPGATQS